MTDSKRIVARGVLPKRLWVGPSLWALVGLALATLGLLAGRPTHYGLAPLVSALGLDGDGVGVALVTLGGLVAFVAPLVARRAPTRLLELTVRPGSVRIAPRFALLPRTVTSDRVVGMSLAKLESGATSLVIQAEGMSRPITLELASLDDGVAVERALAIGRHGFGHVAFPLGRSVGSVVSVALRAFFAPLFFLGAVPLVWMFGIGPASLVSVLALVGVTAWSVRGLAALSPGASHVPSLVLDARGIALSRGGSADRRIAFTEVTGVDATAQGLVIRLAPGWGAPAREELVRLRRGSPAGRAVTPFEAAHFTAQVRDACARAAGLCEPPPDHEPAVEALARAAGEDPAAHRARLDALGKQLGRAGAYRGAAVTAGELWSLVDDAACEPEVRAAAARVLVAAGEPDAAARVGEALASARTKAARLRFEAALTDGDAALELLREADAEAEARHVTAGAQ